jgi:hypothetical protein
MAETRFSIDKFLYRPELIEPGTVYHYIKSNIDGSYPARIFIHVRDNDHLEVLKFEKHGMDCALVQAHMDWQTFSADRLESWVLTPDGKKYPQACLSSSYTDKTCTISWQGQNDVVTVGHYPVHVYNFDFISLNYILRHWNDPEGEVTIGILQPNFDPDPKTIMNYEGTVLIKFLEEEEHHQQPCRKYRIWGEGLKGCDGLMWVNKSKGYIEDIEISIADNPNWDNFKFKFISSEQMDVRQWTEFMDAEIGSLKAK